MAKFIDLIQYFSFIQKAEEKLKCIICKKSQDL